MSKNFAEKVIDFNRQLHYTGKLPPAFQVINPYIDNPETLKVAQEFYRKFYADTNQRKFIIGINPGRHGAGVTGIPFTDTKRLENMCGIKMQSAETHEVSSVFVHCRPKVLLKLFIKELSCCISAIYVKQSCLSREFISVKQCFIGWFFYPIYFTIYATKVFK